MTAKEPSPLPPPTCPLCGGTKHRREVLRVYDDAASQKKPLIALTCKRCSHVLMFVGGSNVYAVK